MPVLSASSFRPSSRLPLSARLDPTSGNVPTFTPEQAAEAYVTANRDRASTMGLIFGWTGELKGKK